NSPRLFAMNNAANNDRNQSETMSKNEQRVQQKQTNPSTKKRTFPYLYLNSPNKQINKRVCRFFSLFPFITKSSAESNQTESQTGTFHQSARELSKDAKELAQNFH